MALWKRLYASLSEISCHYACNFPRGRDGGGRESRDIFADSQDMAVYQTLNEVRRSLPRATTIFLEWHNTNPSAVFSASRQEKIGGRVSLSRITWQTKVGRCLSNEFLIVSSMHPSYTVFVTLFENYYKWRLLNYYNWRIILIDLIIRDIFIIIICVFRRRSNGFQPKRTHPLLECAAYCYGKGN